MVPSRGSPGSLKAKCYPRSPESATLRAHAIPRLLKDAERKARGFYSAATGPLTAKLIERFKERYPASRWN
ncbi:hypothetical protein [Amycolatopsis sp. FDAARGOS 1241]|uniref:hypothetical protein n=1 Tax=Amycolatopsis sp. FDAARGOS 1241 TaxID=2778070 RepID=UPI0019501365|nr:hypothetical protein [Amycolatopsis sp. FDAARGOS 1241]QRP47832.1 hypothetical protein I6J71_07920 [Amycolatopsis sp. FDAARGOS 1241]